MKKRPALSKKLKGHIVTQETRDKISIKQIGKPRDYLRDRIFTKEYKKNLSEGVRRYYKNNPYTEEARLKNSIAHKGMFTGNKHPMWKGGVSGKKEYWALQRHNRRLLMKKAGKLTTKIIQIVYEDNIKKYGTLTCYLCKLPIEFGKDCLEHKIPLSRHGTNKYCNLGIAHRSCNSKKRNKTESEYKKEVLSNVETC